MAEFVGAMAFVGVATVLVEETPGGAATKMVINGSIFNLGTAVVAALGGLLLAHGGFGTLGVGRRHSPSRRACSHSCRRDSSVFAFTNLEPSVS